MSRLHQKKPAIHIGSPWYWVPTRGQCEVLEALEKHNQDLELAEEESIWERLRVGEKTPEDVDELVRRARRLERIEDAADQLANGFAWSAVEADCVEAQEYLQSLIDRLRDALEDK